MFDFVRSYLHKRLRVPHEPAPPAGAPDSLRVFRAGKNYYKLKLIGWGIGQAGALVGIAVSLWFLSKVEHESEEYKAARQQAAAAAVEKAKAAESDASGLAEQEKTDGKPAAAEKKKKRRNPKEGARQAVGVLVERSPWWFFPLVKLAEYGGILIYLVQIPLTYAMVRLDYELRWYMVTDRSLRIRTGLMTVQETTMSFANVQQVSVSQGPLQRLLGLADVQVRSAGGGDDMGGHPATAGESMHRGVFHCVTNAQEIRDLILERLRRFRQAGLGDPDDHHADPAPAATATPASPGGTGDALTAARELLDEARALRSAVS